MAYWDLTQLLQEKLQVDLPPVALAYRDEPPPGILVIGKESPSFCTFWRWAERAVFYAAGDQHLGCLVGGLVSGFPMSDEQRGDVQRLLGEMCPEEGEADRVEDVPVIASRGAGVLYGPLHEFPGEPDVVLFWTNMVQAAVMQEVTGPLMWKGNPQGAHFARPACSVLAIALGHQKNAYSLGCVGMRAYTQIPSDLGMLAIPGSRLAELERGLATIEDPQARLQVYYDRIRAAQQAQAAG